LDAETVDRLERLGGGPLDGARELDTDTDGDPSTDETNPLAEAERKFDAADVLLDNGLPKDGVELAAETVVRTIAERFEVDNMPDRLPDASVWLYADIVAEHEPVAFDTGAATRLFSLLSASSIPAPLARELLADARRLCEQLHE
ncbi:MAG: hypothetical protein ABEN55_10990, partial [Bradymonadaceae bacterium]